jgi:predicted MFS family arabinose efflux permease
VTGVRSEPAAPAPGLGRLAPPETWAAAAIATVGVLPAFLVGALGPELRDDLRFTTAQLGLAVSAAFLAQALVASPLGGLIDRLGPSGSVRSAAALAVVVAIGLSAAQSWTMLTLLLAASGVANGIAQLAASTTLAQSVPAGRQGAAFGIKEAAKPAATFACGVATPLVAALASWRLAFVACAAAALVMLHVARTLPAATPERRPVAGAPSHRSVGLLLVAAGSALGSAVATPLGVFLVETLARAGFSPGAAGALLAAGSVSSIAARVLGGIHADRFAGRQLRWVAAMLAVGAVGLALLATGRPEALVLGTLIAFGGAWGWPGLLNLAVARRHPDAVGAAAGVVLTGAALGGGIGPLAFGMLAEHVSFAAAWLACGGLAAVAACTVLAGRRALRR